MRTPVCIASSTRSALQARRHAGSSIRCCTGASQVPAPIAGCRDRQLPVDPAGLRPLDVPLGLMLLALDVPTLRPWPRRLRSRDAGTVGIKGLDIATQYYEMARWQRRRGNLIGARGHPARMRHASPTIASASATAGARTALGTGVALVAHRRGARARTCAGDEGAMTDRLAGSDSTEQRRHRPRRPRRVVDGDTFWISSQEPVHDRIRVCGGLDDLPVQAATVPRLQGIPLGSTCSLPVSAWNSSLLNSAQASARQPAPTAASSRQCFLAAAASHHRSHDRQRHPRRQFCR